MSFSSILIWLGAGLLALGTILKFAPGAFSWFGHLPGDLRIDDENRHLFVPVTSMIVVSLILSLLLNWWLRR
ncbi:MAG: DUF2905 domain-containing protein [Methylococcaceae bacterium]|nr:DUF2905 domain-containing protein [Methylococcaceae bacterium]